MNWDLVKVFLSVANLGSATAAARQLGVNHATVLRRLEQCEAQLGLTLFTRKQTGFQLTDQGHALLKRASMMETAATNLLREAKGLQDQPAGKLIISQPENALIDISPTIAAFMHQYPQIQLQVQSTSRISDLNKLEADIAIRLTNNPPEHLIGRSMTTIYFHVYASADYLQRFSLAPQPSQCQWILWSGTATSQLPEAHHPDQLLASQLGESNILLRSDSVAETLAIVKQGLGVGLFSESVAMQHDLIRLPFDQLLKSYKLDHAQLWLLRHKDLAQSQRAGLFMQFFVDNFPVNHRCS